jgi:hypothetical protein
MAASGRDGARSRRALRRTCATHRVGLGWVSTMQASRVAEHARQGDSLTGIANYCRVVRASGALKPRKAQAKAAPARTTRGRQEVGQSARGLHSVRSGNDAGTVDQMVAQLVASMAALTEAVKTQDAVTGMLGGSTRSAPSAVTA